MIWWKVMPHHHHSIVSITCTFVSSLSSKFWSRWIGSLNIRVYLVLHPSIHVVLHTWLRIVTKHDLGFLAVMVNPLKTITKRNPCHFWKALVMVHSVKRVLTETWCFWWKRLITSTMNMIFSVSYTKYDPYTKYH